MKMSQAGIYAINVDGKLVLKFLGDRGKKGPILATAEIPDTATDQEKDALMNQFISDMDAALSRGG